jgi:hypothetical protein
VGWGFARGVVPVALLAKVVGVLRARSSGFYLAELGVLQIRTPEVLCAGVVLHAGVYGVPLVM